MRQFAIGGITLGQLLVELNAEIREYIKEHEEEFPPGKLRRLPKIRRVSFYRLDERLNLPKGRRTSGNWRVYTREEVEEIKRLIKEDREIYDTK